MYLVLQGDNSELFTFATSSMTGRRAVGGLLRHYDRLRKSHPRRAAGGAAQDRRISTP
jgi:hypothetical protein